MEPKPIPSSVIRDGDASRMAFDAHGRHQPRLRTSDWRHWLNRRILRIMIENPTFTISVAPDAQRPGRYRWNISENSKVRDKSLYSFATRREAQADADKFVGKLDAIWRPHWLP